MKKFITLLVLNLVLVSNTFFSQYSCSTALTITNGYTSSTITSPGTSTSSSESWVASVSTDGNTSTTGFTNPDVYTFKYTTGATSGESFYFTIECDYAVDGEHSVGVWTGCTGTTLSSCIVSTYSFDNIVGVCAKNLNANTTYYIGVGKEWASSSNTASGIASRKLKFKVIDFTVETTTTIPSDNCNTAASINIANPYDGSTRCNYSASAGSPSVCGMSIENDSWMKFTAGSTNVVIDYDVYNCTNGYGVQLAIFGGTCGSLSLISGSCVNYASNNAGGTWNLTGLTIGNTYFIRTDGYAGDLCSYSFTPVAGVAILPIELVSFEVENLRSAFNKLTWTTASETNSSVFILENSNDGKTFSPVKTLAAQGNSTQLQNYVAYDKASSDETIYYRLKMVDIDGKFAYSKVIATKNEFQPELTLFPNPTKNGKTQIKFSQEEEQVEITLLNQNGIIMQQFTENKLQDLELNLENYAKGMYFVKCSLKNEVLVYRLMHE